MEPISTTSRTLTVDDFFKHIGRLYVSWQETAKEKDAYRLAAEQNFQTAQKRQEQIDQLNEHIQELEKPKVETG